MKTVPLKPRKHVPLITVLHLVTRKQGNYGHIAWRFVRRASKKELAG